ncbi:MAG: helix-turn-helix domain-containing protein [Fusobacterium sp.]|nr:helix-turn-helix domain-containing protein [Fusobacterium sp.]
MSEYLSKEEIKQWRSSLEKITLEEFAARLGKKVEETKPSHDLADIVLKGQPVISNIDSQIQVKGEKLNAIAERAMNREKEISFTPFSMKNIEKALEETVVEEKPVAPKKPAAKKAVAKKETKVETPETDLRAQVNIVFKKALTDREQRVFNYFFENKNKIVYAKDLATLLELPKDYVYKYIKNIRAKLENGELQNAEQGGFLLSVR